MGKATPLKFSFNAGELSPLLDGRTDQEKYYSGCSILENFIPTVQGPIIRRGGTYYVNPVKDSSKRCWLRRFSFNVNQSYLLEFGDLYVRFYTNRGVVEQGSPAAYNAGTTYAQGALVSSSGTNYYSIQPGNVGHTPASNPSWWYAQPATGEYEVPTPYAIADLTDDDGNLRLNFRQSGDVLYITNTLNTYPIYKLSRLGTLDWTLTKVSLANGPFKDKNTDKTVTVYASASTGTGITLTASSGIFESGHVGSLFYIEQAPTDTQKSWEAGKNVFSQDIRRASFNYYQAESISGTATISGVSNASKCVITATAHGFITGDFVFIDGIVGTVELNGQWYYVRKASANTFYILDADDQTTFINSTDDTAYTSGGTAQKGKRTGGLEPVHTEGARTDGDPGVNWTYLHSGFGIVQITAVGSPTSATADVISRVPDGCVGSTNASYLWAQSLYSDVEGYPELVAQYQERFAYQKGLSLACSVPDDFENFAAKIGGQVTTDAAIRITLPDTNPGRWLMDANDLLVGTGGREIAVGKITTSNPLGPENVQAIKQTSYGSRAVEPVEVGNSTVFVTRTGKKLREVIYDWTRAAYVSSDLSVLSEHIAKNGLCQITYQQEPYSIIWGCTAAGELVGFTFNREQDVLAWHRHPVGGSGIVESVQCIPSPDGDRDDLWLIVRRTINGVTKRYVEYMVPEFDGDDSTIADAFYVDAGLTYSGSSTSTITGLDHLEGCTIDILAQGAQHAQKTVSSGAITLDFAVTKAQVGLPCPCKIRTMRAEGGSQLGTSQGKMKRITRILARLLKSLGGKYGPDTGNLDEFQYRDAAAAMDAPPTLFTGDKVVPLTSRTDTDGYVVIYSDVPQPITVNMIVTDLDTNEY